MSLFLFKLAYHNAFFALCQVIHEWLFEFWMLAQKFQKTNGIVLKEQITWKKIKPGFWQRSAAAWRGDCRLHCSDGGGYVEAAVPAALKKIGSRLKNNGEFTASNACLPCRVWKREGFLPELDDTQIITSLLRFFTRLDINASW